MAHGAASRLPSRRSSASYESSYHGPGTGIAPDPVLASHLKEALSNKNWGCSNSILYEIAAQTDYQLPAIQEEINKVRDYWGD